MSCTYKNFKNECYFYDKEDPDELCCDTTGTCLADDELEPAEICMFFESEDTDD